MLAAEFLTFTSPSVSHKHTPHSNHPPSSVSQVETQQRAKKTPRLLDPPKMPSQSNRGPSAWGENRWNDGPPLGNQQYPTNPILMQQSWSLVFSFFFFPPLASS